ncbi:MAG TPA: hypothetical protein EYQ21_02510 [Flavobacteriales bacterium]|nr:hypothetical protein [Flavobacteriales bacterium]
MEQSEKAELIRALQTGVVLVAFTKVNTEEVRIMPCSVNVDILESYDIKTEVREQNSESEQIVCFALDKLGWRSFIASTVIRWEIIDIEDVPRAVIDE